MARRLRIDPGDAAAAPHLDAVSLVVLGRIGKELAPVAMPAEHLGQVVAVVEEQAGQRQDGDAGIGLAFAQGLGGLAAGHAAADDDVVSCVLGMFPISDPLPGEGGLCHTSVSSQREIEMHCTGQAV
jgi:hypothetical protein